MNSFTPSVKRLGTNGQDQFKRGIELAKDGKLQDALFAFKAAVQADPELIGAHIAAGNLLFRLRQYDEALTHFDAATKLDPLLALAPLKAGNTYLRQEKLDQALEQFGTAIGLDPHSTGATFAYVGMGQAYLKQEQYEAAIQQFRKALRLNPQMMMPRLMIATALKQQDKSMEAIAELKTAITLNSNLPISHLQLGTLYTSQKNYGDAKNAFEAAINLDPKAASVKYAAKLGLAFALIELNSLQSAAELLREIPENKQYAARKHKLFGDLYSRQGLPKESAEEYRAATLLGSPDSIIPSELDHLEELDDQDERWEELLESYRSAASAVLQAPGTV